MKYYNTKTGRYILGHTTREGKMFISPFVVNYMDDVQFKATVGHELVHVWQYYHHLRGETQMEKAAYRYTYDVYMANGYYGGAFSTVVGAASMGYWGSYSLKYSPPLGCTYFQ